MMCFKAKTFYELDDELSYYDIGDLDKVSLNYCISRCNDPISKILNKYNLNKDNKIEDTDSKYLNNISSPKSLILNWIINIFLAYSKSTYHNSRATEITRDYLNKIFESIEKKGKVGVSFNVFITFASFTIHKFPSFKNDLADALQNKINHSKVKSIYKLSILNGLMSDGRLISLFRNQSFLNILFDLAKLENYDISEIYVVYDYYDLFLKKLSENYLTNQQSKTIKKFIVDFVLHHHCDYELMFVHQKFPLIRDFLDDLGDYSDSSYKMIDDRIDLANKEALKGLKKIDIPFSDDVKKQIAHKKKLIDETFNKLNNSDKITSLLCHILPFDIKELKNDVDYSKENSMLSMISESFLGENGEVINYKALNEKEMFSLDARQYIDIQINFWIDLYFSSFYKYFNLDDESTKTIKKMLTKSDLIENNDIDKTINPIYLFFKKDFLHSIGDIIINFEGNLRKYLKRKGLNIYKRDKSHNVIDLNYIFNNHEVNSFRDCLLEIIDEDYYFTLKWLLTDKYGFNLRNQLAHDLSDRNILNSTCAIFTTLQILKLYFYYRDESFSKE